MIEVDYRIGSVELESPLKRLVGTKNVRQAKLPSADFRFAGNGPEGRILIGIERKRVRDLVSSIQSSRLGGFQMKNMRGDYDRIYLLVEGYYRPGRNGELENGSGAIRLGKRLAEYSMIDNYLNVAAEYGVRVKRSGSDVESAWIIANLWKCWSKPWKDHKSQSEDVLYTPIPGKPGRKPSTVVRMIAQIEGIDTLAWKLGAKFATPLEMCRAKPSAWVVPGRIGEARANAIVKMLRGNT
jgi:ERCC4-type nuclease